MFIGHQCLYSFAIDQRPFDVIIIIIFPFYLRLSKHTSSLYFWWLGPRSAHCGARGPVQYKRLSHEHHLVTVVVIWGTIFCFLRTAKNADGKNVHVNIEPRRSRNEFSLWRSAIEWSSEECPQLTEKYDLFLAVH